MTRFGSVVSRSLFLVTLALALVAGAGARVAHAQSSAFPRLSVWAYPGEFRDSSRIDSTRCVGSFGVRPDSLVPQSRKITLRFLRDRVAEARPDFGGYRIYRVEHRPDTSAMMLVRRYSINRFSEPTWNQSRLNSRTMNYVCPWTIDSTGFASNLGPVANDSIITFVDSDSAGSFQKVCRRVDHLGRCITPGDSVFRLVSPPGPHDGFRLWYSVTYEKRNTSDQDNEDLFVADTLDGRIRCTDPADRLTCPNLNSKLTNILAQPVEPTSGPSANLERVGVVPNPYRANEVWETPGGHELQFVNLPPRATIKIYTVAGDLVRVLDHNDNVRNFERWDLLNDDGRAVGSGIYMYRVESAKFSFQNRFVVIR